MSWRVITLGDSSYVHPMKGAISGYVLNVGADIMKNIGANCLALGSQRVEALTKSNTAPGSSKLGMINVQKLFSQKLTEKTWKLYFEFQYCEQIFRNSINE